MENLEDEIAWAEDEGSYGGPRDGQARQYLSKYRSLLSRYKFLLKENNELKAKIIETEPPDYVGSHRHNYMEST